MACINAIIKSENVKRKHKKYQTHHGFSGHDRGQFQKKRIFNEYSMVIGSYKVY